MSIIYFPTASQLLFSNCTWTSKFLEVLLQVGTHIYLPIHGRIFTDTGYGKKPLSWSALVSFLLFDFKGNLLLIVPCDKWVTSLSKISSIFCYVSGHFKQVCVFIIFLWSESKKMSVDISTRPNSNRLWQFFWHNN